MNRPIAIGVSLLVLGTPAARTFAGRTLDEARRRGIVVAGGRGTCPPFGSHHPETGAHCGYDVDLVKAIAARLGVKALFSPVTPANRIPEFLDGDIDIIAATMTKSPDRGMLADFSDAYYLALRKVMERTGS